MALLFIKWKELHIDFAGRLVDRRRVPGDLAGVMQDGLSHDGNLVVSVGAVRNPDSYFSRRGTIV